MKRRNQLAALSAGLVLAALSACTTPAMKDADEAFASASDRAPTAHTLYTSSRILAGQGREEESFWTLKRINRDYPAFAPAWCDLSEWHMRHNQHTEAVAALETGLKHCPQDPVLLNNLGMCHMMKGDHEQALAHFTQAAAQAPGNARYRANVATALGMMGRYDESFSAFEQVLQPNDAHFNVGVCAEARQDNDRAQREFMLAQGVDPDAPKEAEEKDAK
jgi:Flp pilus assembly protein TadD